MKKDSVETNGNIRWRIGAVLIASAFIVLMILMGPVQDTGDDAIMAWQLSRGIGSLASFISPYLSLIMNWLYQIVPWMPWWSLLHALGAWVLLIVTCEEIERKYTPRDRLMAYPVIFAATWLALMRHVNFTRTAAAFSLAGMVLCLRFMFEKREKQKFLAVNLLMGAVLFCIGSMIRFQAGLLVLPYVAVLIILRQTELHKKGIKKNRAVLCGVLVIAFVTAASLVAEGRFWNTHPDWEAYREYSSARSAIVDYVDYYPSWEQAKEQYTALGLKNENDLDMLFHKIYIGDPDIFSLDTLKSIAPLRGRSVGAWTEIKLAVLTILFLLKKGTVILWLALWFAYMVYRRAKSGYMLQLLLLGVSCVILVVFSLNGRMALRVWEPLLLITIVLSMLSPGMEALPNQAERIRANRIKNIAFTGLIFLLMVSTGVVQNLLTMHVPKASDDRDEINRGRAEYMQSTADRIYLLTEAVIHSEPDPSPFGLWEAIPRNYLENYFSLSNWEMNTPTNLKRLEAYGITNPTLALLERTDTYSEYSDDRTFIFLKSHYGDNITCSFVDTYPDGGAIVQYTAPIGKEILPARGQENVQILKWEADDRWENGTWHMEGYISSWDKKESCEALYCDIEKSDGREYTFRLALEDDGSFNAFFYDVDAEWMEDVAEVSIVALGKDGTYYRVGEWNELGGGL